MDATVIGLDTATEETAVAACRGAEVLHESSSGPAAGARPLHAELLLPALERAVEAVGGWGAVERLAVGVGPGSFTGLRIGIATARGLAQSLGLALVPVVSLEALAVGVGAEGGAGRGRLAVLDARRGEAFAALWDAAGDPLWPPFVASPQALAARVAELPESPLAAGDGALRFRDELVGSGAEVPDADSPVHRVSGRDVCAIGARADPAPPEAVVPLYLRKPDAERWRDRDN